MNPSSAKHCLRWRDVAAFRLARHHLLNRSEENLLTVCRDMCGVQAQLNSAAELQLWARMGHITRDQIRSALWERRELVKTSLMRRTLHWIPACDFSLYICALRSSRMAALMRVMSKFNIRQEDVEAMNGVILELLKDGPLSKSELTLRLKPRVGKKIRAWMEKVSTPFTPALTEGLICYGAGGVKQATFIAVENWLPAQKKIMEADAQASILRLYLAAYGPATASDFRNWSGISSREIKPVWNSLKSELQEVWIENQPASILARDLDELSTTSLASPVVRLLPAFDPYLLAHAQKKHLVSVEHYKRVYRPAAWISAVVLLNGRIAGTWTSKRWKRQLVLGIQPFQPLSRAVRAGIEIETERLAVFLNSPVDVKYLP